MKQIFILMLAAAALVGCEDKKQKPWDSDAMVSIRPAAGVKAFSEETNPNHLSAKEIVEQAATMWWYNKLLQETPISRSFGDHQRDTVNNRLLMFGTDIIGQEGHYVNTFIKGEDMVLIRGVGDPVRIDTCAYIPNAVLREADIAIKTAYDAGDYETCYRLFDKAFTFIPITGEEWRELKKQGLN